MSIFVPAPIEIVNSGGTNDVGTSVIVTDPVINQTTIANTVVNFTTENFETTDNLIEINKGETSAGVSKGIAGIAIDRGSLDKFHFIYNENNGALESGLEFSSKNAVMGLPGYTTFPDGAIPAWNATGYKMSNTNYIPANTVNYIKSIDQKLATTSNVQFADIKTTGKLTASGNALTFPTGTGASGYILSTDGSGNLSWIPAPSGGGGSTSSIIDSTTTTSINVERTAADKTIRLRSDNIDVLTATANNININAGITIKKTTITSTNYTAASNDFYIYYAGSADAKVHLPDVTASIGRQLVITNNTVYALTIDNVYSQKILGSTVDIILYLGESIKLLSNGIDDWV